MVDDVGNILTAAQRARLLAIQKTARQLDGTSLRLATGQKVNSALDNPGNYFLSRALRSRAGDLQKLLDGIGQSIRVIEEADHGIKAQLQTLDLAESYLEEIARKFRADEVTFGPSPNDTLLTFAGVSDIIPYDTAQDVPASGTVTVNGNNELILDGNFWKRKAFTYTITPDTILAFDFRTTFQGEFSTIGFDNDQTFSNDSNRFYLSGVQPSGLSFAAPRPTYAYSGGGAYQHYEIPVGTYFTGTFTHIVFIQDDDVAPFGNGQYKDIIFREAPSNANLQAQEFEDGYAKIVGQLDDIAKDAHYRGINLLKKDNLTTFFNETHTSKLVSKGIDATHEGLGLQTKGFATLEDVEAKLSEVRAARKTLRGYSSTLATDLNVIKIRNDFTRGQINVLDAGANELTNADLNEEGASLLALQTRQQIQFAALAIRPVNILLVLA